MNDPILDDPDYARALLFRMERAVRQPFTITDDERNAVVREVTFLIRELQSERQHTH